MFVVSPAFLFTVKERRNVVKLDHIVEFVVGNLAGILLIVMMIMVNLTIFSRWVFNINMHGYEELPTILFIVFVWLGVILVVRDDNMLKVDFFLNLFIFVNGIVQFKGGYICHIVLQGSMQLLETRFYVGFCEMIT